MTRLAVPLLAGLVAVAAPALAADLPYGRPAPAFVVPVVAPSWEGFYAGTFAGGGVATFTSRQAGSRTVTKGGQTAGSLFGYNWQTGSFVYGLEGDIGLHLIRGRNPGHAGLISTSVDTLYSARLRGRLGYDFGDFMPFVAVGVAMNETYQRNDPSPVAAAVPFGFGTLPVPFGAVRRQAGLTAGAGLDYRFVLPNIGRFALRGEYVYETFGDRTYDLFGGPVRTGQSTHFLRAALIYQLGGGLNIAGLRSPAAPGTVDWAGPYGGVLAGGALARPRTRFAGLGRTSFDASGPLGGLYVGSNLTFGRAVIGIEGDIAVSDFAGTGPQPGILATSFRQYIQASTRLRLGYAFDRVLPFVAGGVAFSRSEQQSLSTAFFGVRSENGRVPAELFTVGGGLDYRVAERTSLRAEYLYASSFANKRPGLDGIPSRQQLDTHTGRVGAAYHF